MVCCNKFLAAFIALLAAALSLLSFEMETIGYFFSSSGDGFGSMALTSLPLKSKATCVLSRASSSLPDFSKITSLIR